MFDAVNLILYDGNLTKPKFAIGVIHMNNHCARYAPGVYENLSGKRTAEIMFNRDCLRPDNVKEIFTEILRCAVLHYSHENNIPVTSNKGSYYNKRFNDICGSHGLRCQRNKYGYALVSLNEDGAKILNQHEWSFLVRGDKYTCCRTTSDFDLSCMKCGVKLELVKIGYRCVEEEI